MLIGAIGTGKSTFAEKYCKNLNLICVSGDQIENECETNNDNEIEQEIMIRIVENFESGKSFLIDGLNINKSARIRYLLLAKKHGYEVIAYNFGPGNNMSLERRIKASLNVPETRWRELAERNRSEFQPPDRTEGYSKIYKLC